MDLFCAELSSDKAPWPLPRGGSCEHEKQRHEARLRVIQTAERGLADAAVQKRSLELARRGEDAKRETSLVGAQLKGVWLPAALLESRHVGGTWPR